MLNHFNSCLDISLSPVPNVKVNNFTQNGLIIKIVMANSNHHWGGGVVRKFDGQRPNVF